MFRMIENPRVIDRLWRDDEPKIIGQCEGCEEDIYEGEDVYENDYGLFHQKSECCMEYISNISLCKVAGE